MSGKQEEKSSVSGPQRNFNDELEELEMYIEDLTTFLPLPFCTVNPSGIILNVNKAFCNMTGYDELEIIGQDIPALFDNENEARSFEKEIFAQGLIKGKEMNLKIKNGQKIIINISGALRKDKEGNPVGYFLAFSDISELKKLQKELEKKVEERTGQLKGKIDELERFNSLAVGRELRMIELKQKIDKLKNQVEKK